MIRILIDGFMGDILWAAAACNNKATYEIILCDVHSPYVHVSRPHYRCAGYLFIFLKVAACSTYGIELLLGHWLWEADIWTEVDIWTM